MQLNRNTTGDYKNDRAFIGQDLDTIMRTANQQAQLIASLQTSLAAVQAQLAASNIAVAANGQVSGLTAVRNLQTIAHDASLAGLGTPASPLRVVSSSATTPLLYVSVNVTRGMFEAAATTPIPLLAGQGGLVYIPLWVSLNWKVTQAYSNSPSWRWGYTGASSNFFVSLTPGMASAGTFYSTNAASGYNAVSTSSLYSGKGVEITLNVAPTPFVSPVSDANAVVSLAYYALSVVV